MTYEDVKHLIMCLIMGLMIVAPITFLLSEHYIKPHFTAWLAHRRQ